MRKSNSFTRITGLDRQHAMKEEMKKAEKQREKEREKTKKLLESYVKKGTLKKEFNFNLNQLKGITMCDE